MSAGVLENPPPHPAEGSVDPLAALAHDELSHRRDQAPRQGSMAVRESPGAIPGVPRGAQGTELIDRRDADGHYPLVPAEAPAATLNPCSHENAAVPDFGHRSAF